MTEKYRPDIDGLRAVAVLSVLVCHAAPTLLPGGFVGVDIFFVISGYLISTILMREIEEGRFSLLRFYSRRVRRIFPALVAMMVAICVVGWLCLFSAEFRALGRHMVASALFSENLLLWSEASYFDVSSELKPTLHLWSLAIEEQYYIVWPLILYVAMRQRLNLGWVLAGVLLASFLINLHDIATSPTAAYYSPLGRAWELMVGSALAFLQLKHPGVLARGRTIQSVLGLALIVAALVFIRSEAGFPGFWALLPTLGAALLISAGPASWPNRVLLSARPMVWCGLISYPLYLWHWPLLSYGRIVFGYLSPLRTLVLVAAAFLAAILTYVLIERPIRRGGSEAKKVGLLLGGMVLVLLCGALMATGVIPPRLARVDAPTRTEWDFLHTLTARPDANDVGVYAIAPERPKQVLFIGDSHIAQYAERISRAIAADPNAPGALLSIGGACIPIPHTFIADVTRTACWPLRDRGYAMALEPRFETVVIGGAWNWYFFSPAFTYDEAGRALPLTTPEGRRLAIASLEQSIRKLVEAGKRVVFILDNPNAAALIPPGREVRLALTVQDFPRNNKVEIDARQVALHDELAAMAQAAGAEIIDPFAAVCTGTECRTTTDTGRPLFKDNSHFNPDWAADEARFIDAFIKK